MEYFTTEDMLKCRAKSIDTDEWLYGYIFPTSSTDFAICDIQEDGSINTSLIKPETICRFSGLCDYDGTPIYQHDMVERIKNEGDVYFRVKEEVLFPIRENAWMAGEYKRLTKNSIEREKIRIVGNSLEE